MFVDTDNPYSKFDLLFRSEQYQIFANDDTFSDYLFVVHDKLYESKYVIIDCENIYHDSLFLHMAATYIYFHRKLIDGKTVLYVVGDINQGKSIAPFLQKYGVIKYVSREMI